MIRYIIRRILFSIPVLFIASVLVFAVVNATTDPLAGAALNPRVTQADVERLRHSLGLDKSPVEQYTTWLGNFVEGDWGVSLVSGLDVFQQIRESLINTFILGAVGVAISLIIGVSIGIYSALRQYSWFDYTSTTVAFFGLSVPTFWFALMVQLVFGVYLTRWLGRSTPIFYTTGMQTPGTQGFNLMDLLRHMALPLLVLAVQIIAVYSRYTRASMLEVLQSDYLRTARAKGVKESRVLTRHAMRNALIPLTTQVALDIGLIAGGLVITETIFAWPGMGRLFIDAFGVGDYLVVLPWVMITVMFVILFNLVADIMYAVLDARIRYA
jgi:peptide/nickel transport system permease protein